MTDHADVIREWIQKGAHDGWNGHHPACSTKETEGCDCYHRKYAPALAALDALVAELSDRDNQLGGSSEYYTGDELKASNLARHAAEARVTAHERTASLACDLLNALQPWGLQSPEVRSAATRLTVALAALTPPSEAAALAKEACAVPGCGRQRTSDNRWCQECNEAAPPPRALAKEDTDE